MKFIEAQSDRWPRLEAVDAGTPVPGALLTLTQWQSVRDSWPFDLAIGVQVPNDLDIEELVPDLPRVALVALQFPKLTDGRAYSQARLLRVRWRFAGEVRATGDVIVDMLPLLARTGFDAVELRPDQKLQAAQRALAFFNGHYQGDVVEPRPVFARGVVA